MTLDDVIDDIIGPEARAHMAAALAQGGVTPESLSVALLEQTLLNNLDAVSERIEEAMRLLEGVLRRAELKGATIPLQSALLFGNVLGTLANARRILLYSAKRNLSAAVKHRECTIERGCSHDNDRAPGPNN